VAARDARDKAADKAVARGKADAVSRAASRGASAPEAGAGGDGGTPRPVRLLLEAPAGARIIRRLRAARSISGSRRRARWLRRTVSLGRLSKRMREPVENNNGLHAHFFFRAASASFAQRLVASAWQGSRANWWIGRAHRGRASATNWSNWNGSARPAARHARHAAARRHRSGRLREGQPPADPPVRVEHVDYDRWRCPRGLDRRCTAARLRALRRRQVALQLLLPHQGRRKLRGTVLAVGGEPAPSGCGCASRRRSGAGKAQGARRRRRGCRSCRCSNWRWPRSTRPGLVRR